MLELLSMFDHVRLVGMVVMVSQVTGRHIRCRIRLSKGGKTMNGETMTRTQPRLLPANLERLHDHVGDVGVHVETASLGKDQR